MQTPPTPRRRGRLAAISAALTAGVATVVAGAAFAAPGVTPASVSATLLPGQSNVQAKSVETSPIPPRPDILFLADTTGSMDSAIANVRTNATSIMNTVRAAQADSQFGAAEYRDFNCSDPFAYRLNQGITDVIADAQAGINQWAAGDGCDTPEAQVNALFEAAQNATGWRSGSSRIIVWFGDASGHDPSGGHTLAQAIAALNANDIRVIAINVATGSPFSDGLNATGQAALVASMTDGSFFPSATPDQVANAILSELQNLPVTVTHSVSCPAGVFATLTPGSQSGTSGDTFPFSETYGVNAGTLAGTYVCTVDFLQNGLAGGPAFRETITITVPPPDLAIAKTGPALVTEGNNVVYTLTARNLGPTIATGVVVTDPVPAGTTFVSAGAGCAHAAGVVTCNAGTLNPGQTVTFTFTVQAGSGTSIVNTATIAGNQADPNLANNTATVVTEINLNPICTAATTGLGDLWPPNHKLVDGQIADVTDPDGDPITLAVTGIQQDEPINGGADGNTAPDATIGSGGSFSVRAERAGTGDGRVYGIAFRATDGLGGQCTATLLAGVPHDQGNGATPVNSAPPWFDSTAS
jgi:uncharacterized repeat protein (TIGR01451 family)